MNYKNPKVAAILASTSDVLFPAELGANTVDLNSAGSDGDTPLHVVIWRNNIEEAKLLIEEGIDVNAVGDMGETALHVAIRANNLEIVAMLLSAGARVDMQSEFKETQKELAQRLGVNLG